MFDEERIQIKQLSVVLYVIYGNHSVISCLWGNEVES
jgi:hypothetical protein